MKLIVGLGNPGAKYSGTRHNVGFDVVDRLAARGGISLAVEKFHAWHGKGELRGESVVLLKPTTFMNRSGQAVVAAGRFYRLELADLLVVVDDLALPVGRIRVRKSGTAGGHNGLQDLIDRLGSPDWCRLRIGIGESIGDPVNYVLGRFAESEKADVQRACVRAADAAECWIEYGADAAMNRFNSDQAIKPSNGDNKERGNAAES